MLSCCSRLLHSLITPPFTSWAFPKPSPFVSDSAPSLLSTSGQASYFYLQKCRQKPSLLLPSKLSLSLLILSFRLCSTKKCLSSCPKRNLFLAVLEAGSMVYLSPSGPFQCGYFSHSQMHRNYSYRSWISVRRNCSMCSCRLGEPLEVSSGASCGSISDQNPEVPSCWKPQSL